MYEVKVNEHNVCNKESVFTVDVKEKEVKESDVTIFDLKIFSRLFIYAIIIGFFYNLTYYNYGFKIDIFNYIEVNDLIFSWISNSKILTIIICFTIAFFLLVYRLNFQRQTSYFLLILIIFLFFLFKEYEKNLIEISTLDDLNIMYVIFIYALFIIILSILHSYSINWKIIQSFKEKSNPIQIEIFYFLCILFITIMISTVNYYETLYNSQKCKIIFIKDTNLKSSNEEYHFIGRTSNVTIFKDSQEKINVINNSDISNIIFDKK